jgi:hypothetical protein
MFFFENCFFKVAAGFSLRRFSENKNQKKIFAQAKACGYQKLKIKNIN